MLKIKLFVLSILFTLSCTRSDVGYLLVNSIRSGEYEVYKILGDTTLQFISNQIGQFNSKIPLNAGSYLILGDCSFQIALIHPNKTTELITHSVSFIPPSKAETGDLFNIQCNRHPQTHPPQHLNQRFELTVFPGTIDMLVGMRPLKLNLNAETFKTPQSLSFDLSALRVAEVTKNFPVEVPPYFVSTSDGQISVAQAQDFGKWQFLLPGSYLVTVNGTQRELVVKEKESISLDPSYLKLVVSPTVDIDRYLAIKGEPYTAELNDKRAFAVNTVYPLISETVNFRLEGATKSETLTLKAQELTTIELRSVEVSLNCGPWEWECLGKRDISLFETDAPYPFMHGSTDLPILFAKEDVQIEIEGAQSLRYKIPKGKRDSIFETGQLMLKPKPSFKPGLLSLLFRVEGDNSSVLGQSYDIPYIRDTRIHLISGTYYLSHYYVTGAHLQTGGTQTSSRSSVTIRKGDMKDFSFDYYIPEDKFAAYLQTSATSGRAKIINRDKPFGVF